MRNLLLLLILTVVPSQAYATVTYIWSPETPSNEGFHYAGSFTFTSEAFALGRGGLNIFHCPANSPFPDDICSGTNAGVVAFSIEYLGPGTGAMGGRNFLDPLLEQAASIDFFQADFVLGKKTATGSFLGRGYGVDFESRGGEFYLTGNDASESCAFPYPDRTACRGSFGTWVRIPEPPAVALILMAVMGLAITGANRRKRRISTPC